MYHPPTRFAMPYGIAADKKTGKIWFADLNGNNISRFDPNTGEFTEFPIPSDNAAPRFIGLDSKGRVWFTEWMNGKIGVVDPGEAGKKSIFHAVIDHRNVGAFGSTPGRFRRIKVSTMSAGVRT